MRRSIQKLIAITLILAAISPVLYITSSAGRIAYGAATVDATSLNIRSGPDTTYPVVYTVDSNERIVILEKANDEWYHVVYRGVEGYVAAMYLRDVLTAENFDAVGKLTGDNVLMRDGPSTSNNRIGCCNSGEIVAITGINNGWYKVRHNGKTGYIRSDFIDIIDGTTAAADTGSGSSTAPQVQKTGNPVRDELVNFALQYVGYSYVYGGASPSRGFDCSGLVKYVFGQYGYDLARSASSQYAQNGVSISKSELLPGDLVFFSSNGGYSVTHVGIYIGNRQFVHASTPKIGVVVSSLDSNYYTNVWYGAKRVLP